ncbi:hypothetical protein INS49_000627 [Diaporthe citri]|uniref:uncharacterized protein n=1 Tax=Diaporthe citri TaxID=83186 RepID=UPI001C7E8FA4|nr:uncharacterized protein INS49_000627 [Diaporthe citri]KAG6366450.1 hypothetical protein INS49_000627 [Diaporthe citri]
MKFSVAAPLVALLTAFILALLALLAGIQPHFMPDAYIVRIIEKPDDPGSNNTDLAGTDKENLSTSTTAQHGNSSIPDIGNTNSSSSSHGSDSITGTSSSPRPASPTHSHAAMETTSENEHGCIFGPHGECQIAYEKQVDKAQGIFPTMKLVHFESYDDHVLIHARSDPGNHTSNTTATNSPFEAWSMHFLTNCAWEGKEKVGNCSKPWDFESYLLQGEADKDDSLEDDSAEDGAPQEGHPPRSPSFLLTRNAVNASESESEDDEFDKMWNKLIKNRAGFSKVHVTGCVLVGLSFLCTAISFFILPALGKWISVGNLVLATLATIFLLTSSIFTAVLANKVRHRHKESEFSGGYDVESSDKFEALV